jgi:NTE family protein
MKALVLSGGGCKGAYQVGALQKWMAEDGNDYDLLCGISVGAINAAYLAQTPKGNPKAAWEKLSEIWGRVSSTNVKKSWFPFGVLEAIWKPSVYNSEPLQKWVRTELDTKAVTASGRKLRLVSVSWNSGEARTATEADPNLADWVLASSSFPVGLLPVAIDGQLWTDGGLRSVTPLGEAIQAGADEIDVIMCSNPYAASPFDAKGKAALPSLGLRAIDIMSDEIARADLKICGLKNALAELDAKYKKVKLRILKPSELLTDNSLDFDPATIRRMMAIGYKEACAAGAGT